MAVTGLEGVALLAARVLFGAVIALMGMNHFRGLDEMAGYADHKGLPAPRASVLASGAVLVLGGLAILTGILPVVGAVAVAAFLVVAAVTMHDFWAVPADQRQAEMTDFLKNVALAGGALAIAVLGASTWAFEIGVRLP